MKQFPHVKVLSHFVYLSTTIEEEMMHMITYIIYNTRYLLTPILPYSTQLL